MCSSPRHFKLACFDGSVSAFLTFMCLRINECLGLVVFYYQYSIHQVPASMDMMEFTPSQGCMNQILSGSAMYSQLFLSSL